MLTGRKPQQETFSRLPAEHATPRVRRSWAASRTCTIRKTTERQCHRHPMTTLVEVRAWKPTQSACSLFLAVRSLHSGRNFPAPAAIQRGLRGDQLGQADRNARCHPQLKRRPDCCSPLETDQSCAPKRDRLSTQALQLATAGIGKHAGHSAPRMPHAIC